MTESTEKTENTENTKKQFRHIVISGGHIWGLHALGAIQKCIEEQVLDLSHIESIHGTSVGSIIAVILVLKPEIKDIIDYFLNRPWHNLIKKYDLSPLDLYNNSGLFTKEFIIDLLKPILDAHDIPLNITIREFYELTKIELFIYVTELNAYVTECMSYKNYSSWQLLDAIYGSCCMPIAFAPLIVEDKCYIDGGLLLNYPLEKCIDSFADLDEVFGISLGHIPEESISQITQNTNIVDFVSVLFMKIYENILFPHSSMSIPYEIKIYSNVASVDFIIKVMNSQEEREKLFDYGYQHMTKVFDENELWIKRRNDSVI